MYNPIKTKRSSIASRERTFRVVNAALGTHTGQAAEILNNRYATGPPTSDPPIDGVVDYQIVFANLGGDLTAARREMHEANTAHLGQLALIVDQQKKRDGLFDELFGRYFKARHGLESFFGKSLGFEMLAVTGDTPRDPTGLINQVRQTVDFLDLPKVELPSIDLDGIQVDLAPMATQLGDGADELHGVLVDIDRERKNAQTTRKAKNDAIAEFDRIYLWVGRALETYFNLAGMHDLAARVRPSIKRAGRRAAEEGAEQGSSESQGKEDAPPADVPAPESS